MPSDQSESVFRRTENTMEKRTNKYLQTLHIKLQIE